MKAAVVEALGQPPKYGDVDEPVPAEGQVVADVRAAALKNIERGLVSGKHYGSGQLAVPGQIGIDAVVSLPDGRRVYAGAPPPGGAMAERLSVDPRQTIELPDAVDDHTAAALPNAGVSAWFALELAGQIQPGQSVLVLGGTGVTGSLAVQLAKHRFGAERVVVAGRNAERLARLGELAADDTIQIGDLSSADGDGSGTLEAEVARLHAERPFDLVVDYLWGQPAEQTLGALANDDLAAAFHRTRYVQVGEMAGPTIRLAASALRSAGIELLGQGGGSVPREAFARVTTEVLPALFTMVGERALAVDTRTRPLSEVATAWDEPTPSGVRTVLVP